MDDFHQLIDKLQSSANILVTVSNNPSVDQLAACIGLTLALNKLDKHATAVFSGDIPDTIEFLKPEETLEKNTDSLRDFIIALDKAKADKLRYKVEDKVVKIFITPYRTSITSEDLDFSQGDFNVDAVVALGVHEQQELDQAITAHGRILHDATVMTVNNTTNSGLGSINWQDTTASSLSELTANLVKQLDKKVLDEQIATALLTGIVAATDRFRNENTTAQTMSISADLMSAGANQQLVTSELEHTVSVRGNTDDTSSDSQPAEGDGKADAKPPKKPDDGTLEIDHESSKEPAEEKIDTAFDESKFTEPASEPLPPPDEQQADEPELPQIHGVHGHPEEGVEPEPYEQHEEAQRSVMTQPPAFSPPLTANEKSENELLEPSTDPLSSNAPEETPKLLSHDQPKEEAPSVALPTPAPQPPAAKPAAVTAPSPVLVPEPTPPAPVVTPSVPTPPAPQPTPPTPVPSVPTPAPQPLTPPEHAVPEPVTTPPPAADHGADVQAARDEVMRALSEQADDAPLPPIAALNAQPLGSDLHAEPVVPSATPEKKEPTPPPPPQPPMPASPADRPLDMPLPPSSGLTVPPPQIVPPTNTPNSNPSAPPPVPPPMMPPAWPPKQ